MATLQHVSPSVEPRPHKPYVGCSSQPTATISLGISSLDTPSDVKPSVAQNRYALGRTLAVLFCPASNGKVFGVTIDLADLPRVLAFGTWRVANFDSANGRVNLYCYCKSKGRHVYLHRFILNAPKDRHIEVDHVHHRNLDNRQSEIHLASKSENQRNKRDREHQSAMRIWHTARTAAYTAKGIA